MTRKDFELIAATLKGQKPKGVDEASMDPCAAHYNEGAHSKWRATVGAFATMCAAQSPRFDRDRFLRACGAV